MKDLELESRLQDYYATFTPGDSGRAVAGVDRVVAKARARSGSRFGPRFGALAGPRWLRNATAIGLVAVVAVAVAAPFWLRSATGPAPTSSATASPTSSLSSASPSSTPSALVEPSSSLGQTPTDVACPAFTSPYDTPHAFALESIPAGADSCAEIGPAADPQLGTLTNDGPMVAFSGFDWAHARDLWMGDLRRGAIDIVYQAAAGTAIMWPQLASGHLIWLEWGAYQGEGAYKSPNEWWVKDMDTQTKQIRTIAHDRAPSFGGTSLANDIRFDGAHLGIRESLQNGARIQVLDWPSGGLAQSVKVADQVYDFALVGDGVLYSAGTYRYGLYGTNHMHLTYCPRQGTCKAVAPDVYDITASGDLVAWVADPGSSQDSDSLPGARLYASNAKLGAAQAISSTAASRQTQGIGGIAAGSGAVAWWEEDGDVGGRTVLTLWTPGSAAPVQLATGDGGSGASLGGGWLVWGEDTGSGENLTTRVRGVPLSAIGAP